MHAFLPISYYECVMDATDALMNAAGIAQGNVATVLPILVVLTLPIMYSILHFIGQVSSSVVSLCTSVKMVCIHERHLRKKNTIQMTGKRPCMHLRYNYCACVMAKFVE